MSLYQFTHPKSGEVVKIRVEKGVQPTQEQIEDAFILKTIRPDEPAAYDFSGRKGKGVFTDNVFGQALRSKYRNLNQPTSPVSAAVLNTTETIGNTMPGTVGMAGKALVASSPIGQVPVLGKVAQSVLGTGLGTMVGKGAGETVQELGQDLVGKQNEMPVDAIRRIGEESVITGATAGATDLVADFVLGTLSKLFGSAIGKGGDKLPAAIRKSGKNINASSEANLKSSVAAIQKKLQAQQKANLETGAKLDYKKILKDLYDEADVSGNEGQKKFFGKILTEIDKNPKLGEQISSDILEKVYSPNEVNTLNKILYGTFDQGNLVPNQQDVLNRLYGGTKDVLRKEALDPKEYDKLNELIQATSKIIKTNKRGVGAPNIITGDVGLWRTIFSALTGNSPAVPAGLMQALMVGQDVSPYLSALLGSQKAQQTQPKEKEIKQNK